MARPKPTAETWLQLRREGDAVVLLPQGAWRIANLAEIDRDVRQLRLPPNAKTIVNGSHLDGIDTAGALVLFQLVQRAGGKPKEVSLSDVAPEHERLMALVRDSLEPPRKLGGRALSPIQKLGAATLRAHAAIGALMRIIGETTVEGFRSLAKPARLRLKELFVQLELGFLDAIPIIILVTFLVGVVIAYLFAIQIEKYGANIFIVDGVGYAMCRELSPVIVAIIVAGRSGSAFTAQIGTMKLNEEIDAMLALGLSPMRVLVLPRLFALVIALPLLVFVGDVASIIGGMLIADLRLGITGTTFIDRLQTVLPLQTFLVGLGKAPVFAAFIAVIGCRMGLAVENNARSVGLNTTSTVVQSIVAVILLDSAFAVIFAELGI